MRLKLTHATIAKLELEPDDIVVLRSKRQLTAEDAANLKDQLSAIIGDHKIVVLPPDLSIEVLEKEPA